MSADPDDLEIAEQEGYDKGRAVGFNDGINHAAQVLLNRSGEHFKNGDDDRARVCRDLSSLLKNETRQLQKGDKS
jgi:hypothetical protein